MAETASNDNIPTFKLVLGEYAEKNGPDGRDTTFGVEADCTTRCPALFVMQSAMVAQERRPSSR